MYRYAPLQKKCPFITAFYIGELDTYSEDVHTCGTKKLPNKQLTGFHLVESCFLAVYISVAIISVKRYFSKYIKWYYSYPPKNPGSNPKVITFFVGCICHKMKLISLSANLIEFENNNFIFYMIFSKRLN
jgi:hypothetical protein